MDRSSQLSSGLKVAPAADDSQRAPSVLERCPATASERFEELDSLRGFAALTVFFYHCIFLLAVRPHWLDMLVKSPAGLLLYGGHQAVILFFILSGFVLYLPYTRGVVRTPYFAFVVKRICRIYLPYLCALVFVVLAYLAFFNPHQPEGLSRLYGWRVLSPSHLLRLIRDHILFLGFYDREYLNGATWTLTEEMRISLIFPLLAALVLRLRARTSMVLAVGCSVLVSLGIHIIHHRTPLEPFHYASMFVLGAVLASNRTALVDVWRKLGRASRWLLVVVSILGCGWAPWLGARFPIPVTEEASDWLIAITASVFLIAALGDTRFGAFLRHRAMRHIGRSSYGIYLLQLPILFIAVNLLWARVPHMVVFALTLATTLAAASLFYHLIERPSMALGKRLARRIQHRGPGTPDAAKAELARAAVS